LSLKSLGLYRLFCHVKHGALHWMATSNPSIADVLLLGEADSGLHDA